MSKKRKQEGEQPETLETRKTNVEAEIVERQAEFQPSTIDEENRTIEMVFSTGSQVKRNTFFGFGEDFIEELGMKESEIRMDRLNSGAPFLNMHRGFDLGQVIGVVESARVENGIGTAKVRFSKRKDVDEIFQEVKDGILRNVSVGYRVHKFEEVGRNEDDLRVLRAVDWEPFEISLVTIGADPLAQVRKESKTNTCQIVLNEKRQNPMGGNSMSKKKNEQQGASPESREENQPEQRQPETQPEQRQEVDVESKVKEAQEQATFKERKRVSDIQKACRSAKVGEDQANKWIEEGFEIEKVRELIIDQLATKDEETETRNVTNPLVGTDLSREARMQGAQNAILYRANSGRYKLDETGVQYRYMSLLDLAREFAEAAGFRTRNMRKWDITRVAFHSTSDFPEVLANTLNKSLRDAFQAAPQTFGPLVRRVNISDFKQVSRTQLGDAPDLEKVKEDGEFKRGSVGETAEKYALDTYGNIIAITRQAIINDDLDAFSRLPELQGRAAADLESDLVWGQIITNPTLADGNALFSSAHNNLLTPGGVPSVTELAKMRAAMAKQTGLNGRLLNVPMRWLIVPSDLETDAEKLVTNITPRAEGDVNPFVGRLQVISEPRLAVDGDADDWYTSATTGDIDIIELGTLEGEEGPMLEQKEGFERDGIEFKIRHDVAAKIIDFRGLQKNEGGTAE